jgi:hypothetical protein
VTAVADMLREARGLVAQGWAQGKFRKYSPEGTCYCADGAIDEAADRADFDALYGDAIIVFTRAIGVKGHAHIWAWNDAIDRTQAEVLAAFDKAIELAEPSK